MSARSPIGMAPIVAALLVLSGLAPLLGGCEQQTEPAFPHNAHLETQKCGEPGLPECPSCLTCHEGILAAEKKATEPTSKCAKCHTTPSAKVTEVAARVHPIGAKRGIVFSHRKHMGLPEIGDACVFCHSGVPQDGAEGGMFPTKPTCLRCHEDPFEKGDCKMCHLGTNLARRVPQTFLRHDEGFIRNHADAATRAPKVCSQCHAQSECTNCHDASQTIPIEARRPDAVERNFVHRGDFLGRHTIEARSNPARCLRCHEISTCDSCHVERGVSANRIGSANPHPVGWVGPNHSGPNFHGQVARRDVVECASCHERGPATNCIRCHKVGGSGGKPHPGGFDPSRERTSSPCRYCHAK